MIGCYREPERPLDPPEPKIVGTCCYCGDDICQGDEIVELNESAYHLDCFSEAAVEILLEQYGACRRIAEREARYGG